MGLVEHSLTAVFNDCKIQGSQKWYLDIIDWNKAASFGVQWLGSDRNLKCYFCNWQTITLTLSDCDAHLHHAQSLLYSSLVLVASSKSYFFPNHFIKCASVTVALDDDLKAGIWSKYMKCNTVIFSVSKFANKNVNDQRGIMQSLEKLLLAQSSMDSCVCTVDRNCAGFWKWRW
jgi:hypothetical protein